MATAPTEPTAPTDKQIALAWFKSGQWKINPKTHGLLYAEDNGLPGRTWVIKTPWKTHHALKRITNAQPIEHVKATYIRLLREVLSWPTDDTTFEPNYSHLEDLFLFRSRAIGVPVQSCTTTSAKFRDPKDTVVFNPLKGAVKRAINQVSNIAAPYRGSTQPATGTAPPLTMPKPTKKKKKKIRTFREEETVKKDQLERGIEATWSTAEVERQVVKKGNVVVV